MRFRRLTKEELYPLEKEFVQFLIVNGIDAQEWQNIKDHEQEKASSLIEIFSDHVFETVLKKIDFLELRGDKHLQILHCKQEKIEIIELTASEKDFSFKKNMYNSSFHKLYKSQRSKRYGEDRLKDIFSLTEKGYKITNGTLFNTLKQQNNG